MNLPQTKEAIAALIPHQGSMCLHDRVLDHSAERILLEADAPHPSAHPLARSVGVAAVHLAEFGAQAMAVHGGLLAAAQGGRANPGLLVSLRDLVLASDRIEVVQGALQTEASVLAVGPGSWQYQFQVCQSGQLLASGRAMVMLKT
ncbi:phosphotransferase [Ahniella affigens]|uniref:Phosphotransferase n=1 Tax=Ahniella affigens TaxID=2021234 RepID=A0A2P1PY66_9GAMM|nr:phosphotransferase [Ahniella affigens]AVP99788.1 phosphotransferase [Ahniella affigens]